MDPYPLLKLVHVLSATLLFGTGLGSAFFLYRSYRLAEVGGLVAVTRIVVAADRLFIAPAVVVQLGTGLWLVEAAGYSLLEGWILAALGLFGLAGACWLPAAWIQTRLHRLALEADAGGGLPDRFHRYMRWWTRLGVVSFGAVLAVFYLMVVRPSPW